MARPTFARFVPIALAVAVPALGGIASCSSETPEAKGQLMLAIKTDMSIPKDIDRIGIRITSLGVLVHDYEYPVGPDPDLRIPATLAVVAGDDPSKPVHVEVWARQAGKIRVLRNVITTVPEKRIAMLPVPIQWLCDGSGKQEGTAISSSCGEGLTCIAGACVSAIVDSSLLPDYDPGDVFGGGTSGGGGTCFDTVGCFAQGAVVALDLGTCSVAAPSAGTGTNVGLVMPPGSDGICGPEACIVPVDQDPDYGWVEDAGRVRLPAAVCTKVQDGTILGVALTTACETKTGAVPVCGPWSSVGADAGTFDAGAPGDASGLDAPSDAPSDAPGDAPTEAGQDAGPCAPPANASRAALCLSFDVENVTLVAGDPDLDGNGRLFVTVLDSGEMSESGPIGNVLATYTTVANTTEGAYSLNELRFDDLPSTVYVLTVHYDNETEAGSFPNIRRGGAWVGGVDTTLGFHHLSLQAVSLTPGAGVRVTQALTAMRRVTVNVTANGAPGDDGQGRVVWAAYPSPTLLSNNAWLGHAVPDACVDATQPVAVEGVVYGAGQHYIVATLDDRNQLTGPFESLLPGEIPGSMVSGSPGGPDAWNVPIGDSVELMGSEYTKSLSILLQQVIPPDGAPPYACPTAPDAGTDAGLADSGVPDASSDGGSSDASQDTGVPDASGDSGVPDAGGEAGTDAGADACPSGQACSTGLPGECLAGIIDCTSGQALCLPINGPFPEMCNGRDDDCDGVPDDGNPGGGVDCDTGLLGPCAAGVTRCDASAISCVKTVSPMPEWDNGQDDDCSGLADDCPVTNGTGVLVGSQCVVDQCDSGFYDFNGDPMDGCESSCNAAAETCNGLDDDCNGVIDDVGDAQLDCAGQHAGAAAVAQWGCALSACRIEACDQGNYDVNGQAWDGCESATCTPSTEVCNGLDDDCNGIKDDAPADAPALPGCWNIPGSQCSHGGVTWDPPLLGNAGCNDVGSLLSPCQLGTMVCLGGTWVCEGARPPGMEVCDGQDNDCNGDIDDNPVDDQQPCGIDEGECQSGLTQCASGMLLCGGQVGPQLETCDGLDNDCDGQPDDLVGAAVPCGTSQGACVAGEEQCVGGVLQCTGSSGGSPEVCDSLDNDCNGLADDGISCP